MHIISTLEFRFNTFDITASEMEIASAELKADFVLRNIESLPTENSGMPQGITTKLAEMESNIRSMQVQSAKMCQEMSDIAQANLKFHRDVMAQQAAHKSYLIRGIQHLQGVVVEVGRRVLSAIFRGAAQTLGINEANEPEENLQNIEELADETISPGLTPNDEPQNRADLTLFPIMFASVERL
jgi:hypothetical protein